MSFGGRTTVDRDDKLWHWRGERTRSLARPPSCQRCSPLLADERRCSSASRRCGTVTAVSGRTWRGLAGDSEGLYRGRCPRETNRPTCPLDDMAILRCRRDRQGASLQQASDRSEDPATHRVRVLWPGHSALPQ